MSIKNNLKSIHTLLIQLNYILDFKQKKKAILVLVTMIIGTILELLSVSIIVPFLNILMDISSITKYYYIAYFVDRFNISNEYIIILLCVFFAMIYIVKNLFMVFLAYIQNEYAASFLKDGAVRMLRSYLLRPYEFFSSTNSSVIMRGIDNDVMGTYNVILNLLSIVNEGLIVLTLGFFLFFVDWKISIGSLTLAFLCMLLIVGGFKQKIREAGVQNRESKADTFRYAYQAISGIKEISIKNRRNFFINEFEKAADRYKSANVIYYFLSACPDRIIEGICMTGFIGIVCVRLVISKAYFEFIPVLGTFAMGAFKILPSFSKISNRINGLVFYAPALNSCFENVKEAKKIESCLKIGLAEEDERIELSTPPVVFKESVDLQNVSWKYSGTEKNILSDVVLSIRKGQSVGLIGHSGAGKTTLADIILGLFQPQQGSVLVDGIDIMTIPFEWSKMVGYVPQSVFLIDDTVRKNIAYGIPDDEIDDEKVWNAIKKAQLLETINQMSNGLDTIVGERGMKLSGGQQQRISIARALYDDPEILVLDEATSALDTETETAVMDAIDALQGIKTLVIVAHRLSTIRKCDVIYEIVDGHAVIRNKDDIL